MTVPCTQEQRSEIWMALRAAVTAAGEAMAGLDKDTSIDLEKVTPAMVRASIALDDARSKLKAVQADLTQAVPGLSSKTREQLQSLAKLLAERYRKELRVQTTAVAFRITQATLHGMKRPCGVKSLSADRKRQLNLYLRLANGLHLDVCNELNTPFYFLAPLGENGRPQTFPRSTLEYLPRI